MSEKLIMRGFQNFNDVCLGLIGSYCPQLRHLDCISCRSVTNAGIEALVFGLQNSDERSEDTKIEIFVRGSSVDPLSLALNVLSVSVNSVAVPNLHLPFVPDRQIPDGGLSYEDEDSNFSVLSSRL